MSGPARRPAAAGRASPRGTGRSAGAPHRVRIVGGAWKRTPIPVADRPGLRPTPDRVRETVFNWLAHLRPDTAALRGLDLFAGTGALGFELASRGAARVRLVERDPQLAAALRALRDRLGAGAVEVIAGDALAIARSFAPGSVDVAFVDPPYDAQLLVPALAALRPLLAPGALVYAEDAAPVEPQAAPLGYAAVRSGRAGRVHFALLAADLPPAGDA